MTVEEIFNEIGKHMIEGVMFHSQMSDYYGFLGLEGNQLCHKYHYYCENKNYKKFCDYYLKHYGRLIIDRGSQNPGVIPENWFNYKRKDVDVNTRKNAVQAGMEKWVGWEQTTKKMYESYYRELMNINEVAAAEELKKYIRDVDKEVASAEQSWLEEIATDFNINNIMDDQWWKRDKYKKKIKEIELC